MKPWQGDAKSNTNLIITKINIKDDKLKNYLLGLGIIKDMKIKLIKTSFFNGPIIIYLNNYQLSISKTISNQIEVDYS